MAHPLHRDLAAALALRTRACAARTLRPSNSTVGASKGLAHSFVAEGLFHAGYQRRQFWIIESLLMLNQVSPQRRLRAFAR